MCFGFESEGEKMEKLNSNNEETLALENITNPKKVLKVKLSSKTKKVVGSHITPEKEITRYYDTNVKVGLTDEIVEQRKIDNLTNSNIIERGKSIPKIILSNFLTFFNVLCFALGIWILLIGSYENLFYLVIIFLNIIIGIFQEIRAKLTIDKLSLLSQPTADVIRNGEKISIPVSEIVLDDIIYYSAGKQIAADSIIYDGMVEVDESLITGESDLVVKRTGDTLLSGTFVVSGSCYARADKVGRDNFVEKMSADARKYQPPKSDLLKSLNQIIKVIAFFIIPLGILMYLNNRNLTDYHTAVTKTAGSMIGMIPAGLFLLTSMSLAVGVYRLARQKTLVQQLYCIETLARVDVLCLDKTGTITDGTMRVVDMIEIKNHTDYTVRELISSMMYAFKEHNATAKALVDHFGSMEILEATSVVPFSSIRKYSAVTFGKHGTFILGAPEYVIGDQFDKLKGRVERFANQGFRVLVLAHMFGTLKINEQPKNTRPIALIVISDHIRDDAIETIEFFKNNGVEIKVISGDNPITVSKIAMRAGIDGAENYISLEGKTDEEVAQAAMEYTVFGRVTPEQKRIIVKTLKENKKTVAMTGDGVNDILALKEADISIAMASGSEATRYVSHLVLVDSQFASMPKVVKEGRRVINNIQMTSTLFLVKTCFSVLLTIMFLIIGGLYPFEPVQLSMIEIFAIGVPSFFLALQSNNKPVKGKFISNVLKTTLPAAFVVLIMNVIIYYITPILNPTLTRPDSLRLYTTISILTTTSICLMVLFKVSRPFNWFRRILFILMLIGCIVIIYLTLNVIPSNPLKLVRLDIVNIIFTLLLIETSYPLISGIEYILKKLKINTEAQE